MSTDFESQFVQGEAAKLAYVPGQEILQPLSYRLLNGPIPKLLIGLSRTIYGVSAQSLPADFVWGASMEANKSSVPGAALLWVARMPMALMNSLSAVLIFAIARHAHNLASAIVAALLFVFDPLMLLHNRRAMSESALIFTTIASMAAMGGMMSALTSKRSSAWVWSVMLGVALAFAMASKHTAVILVLVAASLLLISQQPRRLVMHLILAGMTCAIVFVALNPVMWLDPAATISRMWQDRNAMVNTQVDGVIATEPWKWLATPQARISTALYETLLGSPDAWVYADSQLPEFVRYFSYIPHKVLRESVVAWSLALATAIGFFIVLFNPTSLRSVVPQWRMLLMAWSLVNMLFIVGFIPLAWQRYFIPLTPCVVLLAGVGIGSLIDAISATIRALPQDTRARRA